MGRIILDIPLSNPRSPIGCLYIGLPVQPPEGDSRLWNEALQVTRGCHPQFHSWRGIWGEQGEVAAPSWGVAAPWLRLNLLKLLFPELIIWISAMGPRSGLSSPCPARLQRLEIQAAEVSQPIHTGVTAHPCRCHHGPHAGRPQVSGSTSSEILVCCSVLLPRSPGSPFRQV